MDSLHPVAYRKSTQTNLAVCELIMANLPPRFNFHKHTPDPVLTMSSDNSNAVTFFSAGVEVLKCSHEGFWVRGEKVNQDDKEAQTVYNSFKEWLTWQQLNRG